MDFDVFRRLIRLTRLRIRFLSVGPRFRYCFLSPIPRGMKLASRYRIRRQLRSLGISPKIRGMPVVRNKKAPILRPRLLYIKVKLNHTAPTQGRWIPISRTNRLLMHNALCAILQPSRWSGVSCNSIYSLAVRMKQKSPDLATEAFIYQSKAKSHSVCL